MLVRLLFAVLTLVGPLPLRVCTCAAGHAAHTHAAEKTQAVLSAAEHHCCHHTVPNHSPTHDEVPSPVAGAEHNSSAQPAQHDRDCPVANQQLVIREAVAPLTPASAEYSPTIALDWTTPPLDFGISARPSAAWPSAMKNPLYLTFLTLRN